MESKDIHVAESNRFWLYRVMPLISTLLSGIFIAAISPNASAQMEQPFGGTAWPLPGMIQAENFDTGGNNVGYFTANNTNQGGQYRTSEGVGIEATTDTGGGFNVGWTTAGEWLNYTVNVTAAGSYIVQVRVANNGQGGSFHFNVDGNSATSELTVPNTGGWQTWQTLSTGINLTAGRHVIRLAMDTVGSVGTVANFNWFSVSAGSGPPATGLAISPFLQGVNDWDPSLPDSVWPIVGRSRAKIVRIGGIQQDNSPFDNSTLLHQVDEIRSAGAEPLIQVSRFQSAQAAANMVHFVNVQNGRKVKFWSIGNEPDLNFKGTDDQLAASVGGYIKSIAPAMRDVDASIYIIAPSMAFWTQTKYFDLLGGADDITGTDSKGRFFVNGIDIHRYGFGSSYNRSNVISEMHSGFPGIATLLLNRVKFANQMHNRSGSSALTWSLTEFNISFANPSPNNVSGIGTCSFLNGQFFAEYFKTGMADGFHDLDTWSIYQDGGGCDGGDLGYLGGGTMTPRSSYYHFQMISQYLLPAGAAYLSATSSNSLVSPLSTISSTNIAVMILNEDTVDHTFSVRLDNNAVQGSGGTKINVPANVPQEHADSIPNQSTMVLVFDLSGTLKTKVTYSVVNNQNDQAPFVQNF